MFRNWYQQAGTPELDITANWTAATGQYSLTFNQSCNATPGQLHKEPFLIPFRLALYASSGEILDIVIEDSEETSFSILNSGKEVILQLTNHSQTIVFSGLQQQPVPSLLRGFSAPIKLRFNYTDKELALLLTHDDDSYSNWEAGQTLMSVIITDMTEALVRGDEPAVPDILINAFTEILENSDSDPSQLAMSIKDPGLDFMSEQFQQVPFDELVSAYNLINNYLATNLKPKLLKVYHQAARNVDSNVANKVGWRKLQNACLSLLAMANDDEVTELAIEQFNGSAEMTNSLAALKVLAHSQSDQKNMLLDTFYQGWQDEELVVDKWFSVQATNPSESVIDDIYKLIDNADFQLSNPNKVRALISSFARNNLQNFHRKDGLGYELVADIIVKLNKINPQIAARLTSSFNRWRHFDEQRKDLMEYQLKRIVELENVSADVYEIASKALI